MKEQAGKHGSEVSNLPSRGESSRKRRRARLRVTGCPTSCSEAAVFKRSCLSQVGDTFAGWGRGVGRWAVECVQQQGALPLPPPPAPRAPFG